MKNNYIIRKAQPNDAKRIIELMNFTAGETDYLSFEKDAIKIPIEAQSSYIESTLSKENCLIIVCEIGDEIVGMIDFSASFKKRMRHCGEFGMMIKKDYWGQGIGRSLIEELISWARETNIVHKINLKVREDNMRAIKLYEDMGFIKEGHVSREFFVDDTYYGVIIMGMEI
jgi:RimJ/RimL family protein N-acetyltransferase